MNFNQNSPEKEFTPSSFTSVSGRETRTSFIQLKLSFSYISLMEYLSLLTHFGRETKGRQMDKYFYPADGNQSPGTALSTGSGKEVTAEAKPRLTRFQLGTSVTISPSSWC